MTWLWLLIMGHPMYSLCFYLRCLKLGHVCGHQGRECHLLLEQDADRHWEKAAWTDADYTDLTVPVKCKFSDNMNINSLILKRVIGRTFELYYPLTLDLCNPTDKCRVFPTEKSSLIAERKRKPCQFGLIFHNYSTTVMAIKQAALFAHLCFPFNPWLSLELSVIPQTWLIGSIKYTFGNKWF